MRALMIERIEFWIKHEGGLTASRWKPVRDQMYRFLGGDPDTKRGRKEAASLTFETISPRINELTDTELLDLFELVMRRAFIQM